MSIKPSSIQPERALRDFLSGKVVVGKSDGGTEPVTVYCDRDKPTNGLPADFISVLLNGPAMGIGRKVNYASGYIMLMLYCKMNDNGSAKSNRIEKILEQFDTLIDGAKCGDYIFRLEMGNLIMPTTLDQDTGYSRTILNVGWHTTKNFNAEQSSGSGSGGEQGA